METKQLQYHIVLGRTIDLNQIEAKAEQGNCPRHMMWALSQRLNATIHTPGTDRVRPIDHLRAKLIGRPEHWALARRLAAQVGPEDVIFCTGEDVGLPIAALCGALPQRPRLSLFIHTGHRPRCRLAFKLFRAAQRIDLFVTNTQSQIQFLQRYLNLPADRVSMMLEQTDTQFFTPGPAAPTKQRPTIVSVGLEKRDYRTLAAATADLKVDVRISAFSSDVKLLARSFPQVMPTNMTHRFYEWPDLVQLYRDADLIVIGLFPSADSAGVTALIEGMACARPVIVTQTAGLADYLNPAALTLVPPQDTAALRQAIVRLLNDPQAAHAQAQRGYELVLAQHSSEKYVEDLATQLIALERVALAAPPANQVVPAHLHPLPHPKETC